MRLFVILLLINLKLNLFGQCMIVPVDLKDLVLNSDHVMEGQLTFKESKKGENGNIYSYYKLEVFKIFKGGFSNEIMVKTFGGQIGLEISLSNPSDDLENRYGLFFLKSNDDYSELIATSQGKIWINNQTVLDVFNRYHNYAILRNQIKELTGQEIIIKEQQPEQTNKSSKRLTPVITSINPNRLSAGTDSVLTINGSAFNASRGSGFVEFSDANSGGAGFITPLTSQYVYWDDTMIRVKLPTRAGTGVFRITNSDPLTATSTFSLTVPYNLTNVTFNPGSGNQHYIAPLQGLSNGTSMSFAYNTSFFDSTLAKAGFKSALEQWRCSTLVNFDTISATTSTNIPSNNSENVVAWDFNAPLSLGVLGVAYSNYSGCIVSGVISWFATDLDVIFNDVPYTGYTWQYGNGTPSGTQFDFESVALHELGHSHQLGHVIDASQTMHYSLSNGQNKNKISINDSFAGINIVSKSSVVICGNSPMTPATNSNCSFSALPLDALVLNVINQYPFNQLTWVVLNEKNIDKYDIQVSTNGIDFYDIGTVYSNQTQNRIKSYRYDDFRKNKQQVIFYRIKTTEFGNKTYYSNVVEIHNNSNISNSFYISNHNLQLIKCHLELNFIKNIKIYNAIGQVIPFKMEDGTLSINHYSKGVYMIAFEYRNQTMIQKIFFE